VPYPFFATVKIAADATVVILVSPSILLLRAGFSRIVSMTDRSGKEVVMVWHCYGLIVALQYPVANHSYLRIIRI